MLAGTGTGARSGASSRSGALDASSSSASGLPAVAQCSRRAVSGGTSGIRLAASSLVRPPIRSVGKNRLHLDLIVDDLDAATAEIEGLGGRWLEPGTVRELEGFQWWQMADPDGNEFDIDVLPAE